MKIILNHPTGNQNVRSILKTLHTEKMLFAYNTTIAVGKSKFFINLLPRRFELELSRRSFPIPSTKINTRPLREYARLIISRSGIANYLGSFASLFSVDMIYQDLDKHVSQKLSRLNCQGILDAVYCYEDSALNTFKEAKSKGLKCIYELPIAFWKIGRDLMIEEAERLPNWAKTLKGGIDDPPEKLERKSKELELADMVVTPSEFVLKSLPSWALSKATLVAPFGSPVPDAIKRSERNIAKSKRQKLRVLFVGSMTQRKGLADLLEAMRMLNGEPIELVVMGSLQAPLEFYKKIFPNFTYLGGRPHDQVLELMRTCDVFCLPSIVEGRALVMQEAMSQGLPLIITPNTGGSDLIVEKKTGFLVPIRSPEKIAEKLSWFLNNRSEIKEMGKAAQERAAALTWEDYGKQIVNKIKEL